MSEDLSKKIIERIDSEKIEAIPRWRFVLRRTLFVLFAILSIVIGGIAVGAILFLLNGFYISGLFSIPHDMVELLLLIPYLWIIVLILFILVARASVRHTSKGYRYDLGLIISISVLSSFLIGSVFFLSGIGKITHQFLNKNPLYSSAVHNTEDAWELHWSRLK